MGKRRNYNIYKKGNRLGIENGIICSFTEETSKTINNWIF